MTKAPTRAPQVFRGMRTPRTVFALMLREIGSSNGRSALGYLWEVLEPAVYIFVLTYLMGTFFRSPPIGSNFPLFFASGILPFMFFMEVQGSVSSAVRSSRPLLSYPGVTFFDAILARFILGSLTKLVIYVLVLTAIVQFYGLSALFHYERIIMALLMAMTLALGVGTLNCLLLSMFPLWERIWGFVRRPLFLASAIVYVYDSVPLPYRDWLWWNPIVHFVGMMRSGLYPSYAAPYVSVTYVAVLAVGTFTVGLFFLRRYFRDILND